MLLELMMVRLIGNIVMNCKSGLNHRGERLKAYTLGHVVDAGKDYCTDDVHTAGMEEENYGIYGKIRDLVKVRIMEAVSDGTLNAVIGGKELDAYYYKPMGRTEEGVVGKREVVVRFV